MKHGDIVFECARSTGPGDFQVQVRDDRAGVWRIRCTAHTLNYSVVLAEKINAQEDRATRVRYIGP